METMPYSANSFSSATADPGHRRIADRIHEGACGARGSVGVSFFTDAYGAGIALLRYVDTTLQFNLAEAFYSGMQHLSSTSMVIGDPKTSVVVDLTSDIGSQKGAIKQLYPNPSTGLVHIRGWRGPISASVTDATGRAVTTISISSSEEPILDLTHLTNGIYMIRIKDLAGPPFVTRMVVQN